MGYLWLATLLLSLLSVHGQLELRTVLSTCLNQPGSNLNKCLKELAQELKPYMRTGIKSMGIPVTEPMKIDEISFDLISPLGSVKSVFTDNVVTGLSNHEVLLVDADKENFKLKVKIFIEKAITTGFYHMSGILGPLELDPELPPQKYKTTFIGATVEGDAQLGEVNGVVAIIGDPDVKVEVEGLDVQMEKLFGGTAPGLAKVVLRFVNKDSKKFVNDFQPEIQKQVSSLIKGFFNSALANIPVESFKSK